MEADVSECEHSTGTQGQQGQHPTAPCTHGTHPLTYIPLRPVPPAVLLEARDVGLGVRGQLRQPLRFAVAGHEEALSHYGD